jgi:hypothetical protein
MSRLAWTVSKSRVAMTGGQPYSLNWLTRSSIFRDRSMRTPTSALSAGPRSRTRSSPKTSSTRSVCVFPRKHSPAGIAASSRRWKGLSITCRPNRSLSKEDQCPGRDPRARLRIQQPRRRGGHRDRQRQQFLRRGLPCRALAHSASCSLPKNKRN